MEIPISVFTFILSKEISEVFDYKPGEYIESIPPLRAPGTDQELSMKEINLPMLRGSKIS
jgi:hypothetical protein